MLDYLLNDPILFFIALLAIVTALSFHEFSHALAGYLEGDSTAEKLGRLTLNPMAHIDWWGLVLLVLVGFGWGKPVPFNPYNLRHKKWGPVIISLAGPFSNLLLAILMSVLFYIANSVFSLSPTNALNVFIEWSVVINLALMFFNLLPIPPLDGSRLLNIALQAPKYAKLRHDIETKGVFVLMGVIIFDSIFNIGIFSALFTFVTKLAYIVFLRV